MVYQESHYAMKYDTERLLHNNICLVYYTIFATLISRRLYILNHKRNAIFLKSGNYYSEYKICGFFFAWNRYNEVQYIFLKYFTTNCIL